MKKCTITMVDQKQNYDGAIARLREMGVEAVWKKKEIANSQDPKVVIGQCRDSSYIINGIEIWNREVIEACRDLELIVRYGVGYNAIDLDAATEHGVAVAYLPGVNTVAVAEHAVMLMMAALRRVGAMTGMLHRGYFSEANYLTPQFNGKTIGVLGCGRIGKAVCRMLSGFDCRLLAYDVYEDRAFAEQYRVEYVPAEELMRRSDIITVHVPVLPETVHIINRESISRMKDGVVIVNTSRGETVCSADLAEALKSGKVYAAGLDVFEGEGGHNMHAPFIGLEQAIITPHVASSTFETYGAMIDKSVEIIDKFRKQEDLTGWLLNPAYKDHLRA